MVLSDTSIADMRTGSFKISSVAEMQQLAELAAKEITGGTVLWLEGELGAGKTTFVQGLAWELGIDEKVTSPSFTVVSEYPASHKNGLRLIHVDLYRLNKGAEDDIAVKDALEKATNTDRVTAIEWADRLSQDCLEGKAAADKIWRIRFSHGKSPEERKVEFEKGIR